MATIQQVFNVVNPKVSLFNHYINNYAESSRYDLHTGEEGLSQASEDK